MVEKQEAAVDDEDKNAEQPNESMIASFSFSSPTTNRTTLVIIAIVVGLVIIGLPALLTVRKDSSSSSSVPYDPFNISGTAPDSLLPFDDSILDGYNSTAELEQHLVDVSKLLISNVVNRNTKKEGYENAGVGGPGFFAREGMMPTTLAQDSSASGAAAESSPVGDVDDFGTNNQEDGVEEGDIVVTDGNRAFAAYGNNLVVWDVSDGSIITTEAMPTFDEVAAASNIVADESNKDYYYYYYARPSIRSLVLATGKLLVVMEGYASVHRKLYSQSTGTSREFPILHQYLDTHLRVYDITQLHQGLLPLISTANINGAFNELRTIGSTTHVVTSSGIDTWTDLIEPFERYQYPKDYSEEQYVDAVRMLVIDGNHVTDFADDLTMELAQGDIDGFPNLIRVNTWQSSNSPMTDSRIAFANGVVNSVTQIFSFDMDEVSIEKNLTLSASGAFLPTSWSQVYAALDTLVVAGQGWEFGVGQSTYLLAMALDGARSKPQAVGKLPGFILNRHFLDVKDGVLRIATSIRTRERFWIGLAAEDFSQPSPTESSTENYIISLSLATGQDSRVMEELGRIKLGKPNELFTAVRFFDNIAYAVTFERTDPLYVLDLSDPANPIELAALEITGFSSYLHSMSDDNKLLLSIGQEADENGIEIGMQVTVFNMSVPSDPQIVKRHLIFDRTQTQGWSYSEALWDFKAIRYSIEAERLIIPVTIDSYQHPEANFRGFMVFLANQDTVEELEDCRVDHGTTNYDWYGYSNYGCNCGELSPRSMIIGGDMMTMYNSIIASTRLNGVCDLKWNTTIELSSEDCCRYHW